MSCDSKTWMKVNSPFSHPAWGQGRGSIWKIRLRAAETGLLHKPDCMCRTDGRCWCLNCVLWPKFSPRFLRRPELRAFGWLSDRPWDEFPATWIDGVRSRSSQQRQGSASIKTSGGGKDRVGSSSTPLSTHCEIYLPGQAASHVNDMKNRNQSQSTCWAIMKDHRGTVR